MSFVLNFAEYFKKNGFKSTCRYSALRLNALWSQSVKRQLERIPLQTMVSGKEQGALYDLASGSEGAGEIIDLGCWLGGTTVPLSQGLMDNPHPAARDKMVHAYDMFVVNKWMDHTYGDNIFSRYEEGDSFLDLFEENVKPWASRIRVHAGDLCQETWNQGPIEVLHIDAMKSWELTNHILQQFFPALIPGKSIVAHQDFFHFHAVWIHLVMSRLREYFELVPEKSNACTMVFRYLKQIPPELLNTNYGFADFSLEEMEAALDFALPLAPERIKGNMVAARVMLYVHLGEVDRAEKEYARALEWEKDNLANTPEAQPSEIHYLPWQIEQARKNIAQN